MFFEFKVDGEVVLVNFAQVARIKVGVQSGELAPVTFFFTDGREETVAVTPIVLQRLYTSLPRPTGYGSGGMG